MATIDELYKTDLAFKSDLVPTASGDLDTVSGLENYRDALYRRLITTPGSMVHRPNYGVGIKSFQNAVNSLSEHQRLAVRIKEQFEQDTRTKRVLGVSVIRNNETPENTKIVIRVEAIGLGEQTFSFTPFGG